MQIKSFGLLKMGMHFGHPKRRQNGSQNKPEWHPKVRNKKKEKLRASTKNPRIHAGNPGATSWNPAFPVKVITRQTSTAFETLHWCTGCSGRFVFDTSPPHVCPERWSPKNKDRERRKRGNSHVQCYLTVPVWNMFDFMIIKNIIPHATN